MRIRMMVAAFVAALSCGSWAHAQYHEVRFGGGIIASEGSGYGFPFYSGGVGGTVHLAGFDISSGYSYGNFPKIGTPGGHRESYGAGMSYWFGDHVFAGGGWSHVMGDATSWTKTVEFASVSGGYRFVGAPRLSEPEIHVDSNGRFYRTRERLGGRHEDVVSFGYYRETKTDAVQPNNSEGFTVAFHHDFPLSVHQAIRWSVSYQYSRYDQFVFFTDADANGQRWRLPTGEIQRLDGSSISFGFSYIIKGSD